MRPKDTALISSRFVLECLDNAYYPRVKDDFIENGSTENQNVVLIMNVVCFHAPKPEYLNKNFYWALYQVMVASAWRVLNSPKFHLYTTEGSEIPGDLSCDHVTYLPIEPGNEKKIHLHRVRSWLEYVSSDAFDDLTACVDLDILFQKDVSSVFQENFDVGLSWECEQIPEHDLAGCGEVNVGVMFFNPSAKKKVISFFESVLDNMNAIQDEPDRRFSNPDGSHPTMAVWGGDEWAIVRLFDRELLRQNYQEPLEFEFNGTRIKIFPSRLWNCQTMVEQNGEKIPVFEPEAFVRHFKGDLKDYMLDYAEQYLGIKTKSNADRVGGIEVLPV